MDHLSPANQAALMQRFAAVFPGQSMPKKVSELPLGSQLHWREVDPDAVAIMEGKITADQQAWLMTNQLDSAVPVQPDPEAAKAAFIAESEARWAAELQQQSEALARQQAVVEANRQVSVDHMNSVLRAQSSLQRGW